MDYTFINVETHYNDLFAKWFESLQMIMNHKLNNYMSANLSLTITMFVSPMPYPSIILPWTKIAAKLRRIFSISSIKPVNFNICNWSLLFRKRFLRSHHWFNSRLGATRATGHYLTHWGRVTQICVGKLTIIGSDNGLSPARRQAISWTNAGILLIGNFN